MIGCFLTPRGIGQKISRVGGRDPLTETEATAFWETLNRCLNQLPRLQRDAFTLNELEPTNGEEIHEILGIKTSHLYVLLHRARLSIRRCLETLWFGERES
ncbi:sigma factor-like helix-turn-helix DNA-binding protein [Acidihalobacter aeolianus]|uniref:sigma factor-like helix-turn-helix DNA-binding protein n=1 Tax=Acidihalobacter aeolianus TaxID=2792603 RepID=UPI0038B3CDF8